MEQDYSKQPPPQHEFSAGAGAKEPNPMAIGGKNLQNTCSPTFCYARMGRTSFGKNSVLLDKYVAIVHHHH